MINVIFSSGYQSGKQSVRKHVSRYFPLRVGRAETERKLRYFPPVKQSGKKRYINITIFLSALLHTVTGTPKARRKTSPRASGTVPVTKKKFPTKRSK